MASSFDVKAIVNMYNDASISMRDIAKQFNTNHKMIGRILAKEGVEIRKGKKGFKLTDEHKEKLSKAKKGKSSNNKGLKMTEDTNRKNMVNHLKQRNITLEQLQKYEDFERLKFLNKIITRYREHFEDDEKYISFLDMFYFDQTFNMLYDKWIQHNKNKWFVPSLDHIKPIAKNGTFDLENLRFISFFENRAKIDMSIEEWEELKRTANLKGDLFL